MSFRQFGGLKYASKHNVVSSNLNTSNQLFVTQNVGQPNSIIDFFSDISGNITFYGDVDISGNQIVTGNATANYMFLSSGTNYSTQNNALMPKSYIDLVAVGITVAGSVQVISNKPNGPVPINQNVGSGYTIDGVTLNSGDYVLLNDQLDLSLNGVYLYSNNQFTRTSQQTILPVGSNAVGALVIVLKGNTYSKTGWLQTYKNPSEGIAIVGTDPLIFVEFYTLNFKIGNGLISTSVNDTTYISVDPSLNYMGTIDGSLNVLQLGTKTTTTGLNFGSQSNQIPININASTLSLNSSSTLSLNSSSTLSLNGTALNLVGNVNINGSSTIYGGSTINGGAIINGTGIGGGSIITSFANYSGGTRFQLLDEGGSDFNAAALYLTSGLGGTIGALASNANIFINTYYGVNSGANANGSIYLYTGKNNNTTGYPAVYLAPGSLNGITIAGNNIPGSAIGNVGIGTTNPGYTLDVSGNLNFTGNLTKGGNPISGQTQWSGTSPGSIYYTGGNVGIGTSTPGYTLDVSGNINTNSNINVNGAPLIPPGTVNAYLGTSSPTGWLICNGSTVSQSQYPALYSVIGTTYGSGSGLGTFSLPNFQGAFLRGTGTSSVSSNYAGPQIGASQTAEYQKHYHDITEPIVGYDQYNNPIYGHQHSLPGGGTNFGGGTGHTTTTDNNGPGFNANTGITTTGITINNSGTANETRPYNWGVNWIIKY